MKKILILSWFSPEKWSGVEKVTLEYGKKLSKKYKILYYFMDTKKTYKEMYNMQLYWFNATMFPLISFIIYTIKTFYFIKRYKPDLIIDNFGVSLLYNIIYNDIKVIWQTHWTCRSFIDKIKFNNIFEKVRYYLFFWFLSIFERNLIRKSYKMILISKYVKEEIMKYYKLNIDNKSVYIYNWYDSLEKEKKIDEFKKQSVLKILFVSNAHRAKWIDILEKVAKTLEKENIMFYIIWAKYINNNIQNIKYLWKLSREDVYRNMDKSDIFFLPSYREWQPLVVLEAMSNGCIPLISWECHMDMIEDTELNEFISYENDYVFYIKKIKSLLDNPDIIKKYKELAMQIIKPYSWDNQTNIYLEVINKILK